MSPLPLFSVSKGNMGTDNITSDMMSAVALGKRQWMYLLATD